MTFQIPSTGVNTLLFANDTKCFKYIKSLVDQRHLQLDLDNLASWSISSHLSFNSSKSTHVSLNNRTPILHHIILEMTPLPPSTIMKILELLSAASNLNWNLHHDAILRKAYRTLGLVWRTFSTTIPSSAKVKLYISIIRSQLLYCSPVWRPHLIKDIKKLEQLQCRVTKYILNDYVFNYKTCLTNLKILPLMYIFEI